MFIGASHLSMALDMLWYGELAEALVFIGAFSHHWSRSFCTCPVSAWEGFGVVGFSCVLSFVAGLSIGYQDDADFFYLLLCICSSYTLMEILVLTNWLRPKALEQFFKEFRGFHFHWRVQIYVLECYFILDSLIYIYIYNCSKFRYI